MPSRSSVEVIRNAIEVLRTIWENSTPDHGLSAAELREALESAGTTSTTRSIHAAVDGAIEAGLPFDRPRTTGPSREGYRVTERPLEKWEAAFLADAVQCSKSLSSKEKASLRARLALLIPARDRDDVTRPVFGSRGEDTYRTSLDPTLTSLSDAILHSRRVRFTYLETDLDGSLVPRASSSGVPVEPYALVYRDDAYYLIAGKVSGAGVESRVYRVDRMRDLASTGELCEGKVSELGISPDEVASAAFDMFVSGEERDVTLSYDQGAAKHIVERFGAKGMSRTESGGRATVRVWVSRAFYAWVFQFGGSVRIIGPDEVLRDYRAMLEAELAHLDG